MKSVGTLASFLGISIFYSVFHANRILRILTILIIFIILKIILILIILIILIISLASLLSSCTPDSEVGPLTRRRESVTEFQKDCRRGVMGEYFGGLRLTIPILRRFGELVPTSMSLPLDSLSEEMEKGFSAEPRRG